MNTWDAFYEVLYRYIPSIFSECHSFMSDRDSGISHLVNALQSNTRDHEAIKSSMSICCQHLKRNIYHHV